MSLALVALLASSLDAHACSSKDLQRALSAAKGEAIPPAYAALAECDYNAAKTMAKATFARAKSGLGLDGLAVTGAHVGAWTELRTWRAARPADIQTTIDAALVGACAEDEQVAGWFADLARVEKQKFWTSGPWRDLGECRQPAVQELLSAAVSGPFADRAAWIDLLGVFGHNLGALAVAPLGGLLMASTDVHEAEAILGAMGQAAQVGGDAAREPAIAALVVAGESAPLPMLPAIRQQLGALGAKSKADPFAARYYEGRIEGRAFHYGVVAVESATCKKKVERARIHTGEATDPRLAWPDQSAPKIDNEARRAWTLDLTRQCKGSGTTTVLVSPEPLPAADLQLWIQSEGAKAKAAQSGEVEMIAEAKRLAL